MPTKLISNKALREFGAVHPDSEVPLQEFRRNVERGAFGNFADLRATFDSVDKVGDVFVFNIGGNKYRLVAGMAFAHAKMFVKAVLTHDEYGQGK